MPCGKRPSAVVRPHDQLGAPWIPADVIEAFSAEVIPGRACRRRWPRMRLTLQGSPGHTGWGWASISCSWNSGYSVYHAAKGRWPRGYPDPPWAFLQPEQFDDLVQALENKGFTKAELSGVLGENYLRLMA